MLLRRILMLAVTVAAAWASMAHAGNARPEVPPSPVDGMSDEDALKEGMFFELYKTKSQKGELKFDKKGNPIPDANKIYLCPVCHQPMHLHADPAFKCVPQGPVIPGTDRRAQPLEIKEVEAKCPVCNAKFVAAYQANINSGAGMDRDFCMHSIGQDVVVSSSVWMCPECGFAGLGNKLARNGQVSDAWGKELDGSPIGAATTKLVNDTLKPYTFERMVQISGLRKEVVLSQTKEGEDYRRFGEYIRQTQIPDWLKYKNAIFLMEKSETKLPHTLRARMYLEGAWACRRQVCSEIGITGLVPEFQTLMGKSIRLMQKYIVVECLNIRQRRHESFVDPAKAETDPFVLAEACANIIKYGEEIVQEQQKKVAQGQPAGDQARFQVGDIFVLRLRQAGFLDRCGKITEALQTLEKARAVIPLADEVKEVLEAQIKDQRSLNTVLKSIELNLQMLHAAVDERADCLKLEREYVFRSAEHLMQSVYFNENAASRDPATSVYWAAELYRRDGRELEVAKACFQCAMKLINGMNLEGKRRRLDDMIAKRKDPTKPGEDEGALRAEIMRLDTLYGWSEEDIGMLDQAIKVRNAQAADNGIKSPPPPLRENIAKALDEIQKRSGVNPGGTATAPGTDPLTAETPKNPDHKTTESKTAETKSGTETVERKSGEEPAVKPPVNPPVAGEIKTREELFKVYYAALTKFVNDKKANPESPSELVSAGYLTRENACLDENGVLVCPETHQKLLYMKGVKFGDKTLPYIYPRTKDPNQKKLYADGHVAE